MGLSSSLPEPVRLPLPFPIGRVNAWLLRGDPLTLVDAGARWDEGMPALEAALSTHGVRIDDVELLVLTHHHDDHAGLAHDVRERSGCQVAAHVATAERLADVPCHRAVEDVWQVALLRLHGAGEETTATVAEVTAKAAGWQASVLVDRVLEDADVLRAGDHELEVLLRPGHSPTDTLFVARAGWALLGDHLLAPSASAVLAERPRGVDDPRLRLRALPRYREGLRKTAAQGLSEGFAGHGAAI
ncbi:MAG: fold metallo-hydrolase, partial [Conexibacter sp.]|nr:fold metallo-hydrolase [Conexibacter sp.]